MSRLGKRLIPFSDKVDVSVSGDVVTVKGPKGELVQSFDTSAVSVSVDRQAVKVESLSGEGVKNPKHGLYWSLIKNMIQGVAEGYEITLELVGVGYRVQKQGEKLVFSLGFSHPVEVEPIEGVAFDVEGQNKVFVRGIDNQKVGQVAANIRKLRKPDAYKGKGVRYAGEHIRLKAGKSVK